MTREDLISIFPLPNVVFFPRTHLPLHIFEPRYREMTAEAIRDQMSIGMFLLQPGWQDDYYGNPPIFPIGCAGELIESEMLDDGEYDIVLYGLYRVRIVEIVQEFPFRKARVEALPELLGGRRSSREKLAKTLMKDLEKLARTSGSDISPLFRLKDFAEIVNAIAMSVQFDVEVKLQLLQMDDVYERAQLLHGLLSQQISLYDWTNRFSHLRPVDPKVN